MGFVSVACRTKGGKTTSPRVFHFIISARGALSCHVEKVLLFVRCDIDLLDQTLAACAICGKSLSLLVLPRAGILDSLFSCVSLMLVHDNILVTGGS